MADIERCGIQKNGGKKDGELKKKPGKRIWGIQNGGSRKLVDLLNYTYLLYLCLYP